MAEERAYQASYIRYRPQGPKEVLGQEHVVRSLMGGVREDRLAHAFLFCGPRGTGKTSTARILAKMINCEKGKTEDPCGVCEQCTSIRDGRHLDVVEIDAASHTGVDDARELREKAPTAPVQGREKVYIIDEAQRLSPQAFDALLKVFEEPPQGVRFILCTTEPHKIPSTIVGRCQRFDFRRVPSDTLVAHLLSVAEKEGIALKADTAETIARNSEGSVRDALSTLDQAAVLGGGKITDAELVALLGAPPSETQYLLADALAVGDAKSMFGIVNMLVQDGQDLRHFTSEALTHFRNLLLAHVAPADDALLDVTADEHGRLRAQATKYSQPEISRIISLLLAAQTDMRWTTSPRLTLELALVRACMPEADLQPHALISRVERLERVLGVEAGGVAAPSAGAAPAGAGTATSPTSARAAAAPPAAAPLPKVEDALPGPAPRKKGEAEDAEPVASAPPQARMPAHKGPVDVDVIRRTWPEVVARLRDARQMILATNLESVTPVSFDGETLEIVFPPDRRFGVKKVEDRERDLQGIFSELLGISPHIRCVIRESSVSVIEEEEPLSEAEALARLQSELNARVAPEGE